MVNDSELEAVVAAAAADDGLDDEDGSLEM